MSAVLDVVSAALFIIGALLALVAAIGLHRLGDTRSRMHAATKPATLGVIACVAGAALQMSDVSDITKLLVIVALQVVTAPVGAHLLGRAVSLDEGDELPGADEPT